MYEIGDEELAAVKGVFDRRRLFRYQLSGPSECEQFETEFSKYLGCSHSLLVTSGTNALIAALESAGVGEGDEVIIPAYTFVATATAVMNVGAIPVIANIDEKLGLDVKDAETKVSVRTKAIIPVHMDGLAANMSGILDLASRTKLVVIEDVAQAIGGSFEGRRLGTLGHYGCFSLNENKNISSGEGGVVVSTDPSNYQKLFCLQDASAIFNPANQKRFEKFNPFMGHSMRVSEITGAIMRVQLRRLDSILGRLRARKKIFLDTLQETLTSMQSEVQIVLGHCAEGDCATSVHLQFQDPLKGAMISRSLREKGILLAPVTTRPAHACWKWIHLLDSSKRKYHAGEYLVSLDVLSRTLKVDLDPSMEVSRVKELAISVASQCVTA